MDMDPELLKLALPLRQTTTASCAALGLTLLGADSNVIGVDRMSTA